MKKLLLTGVLLCAGALLLGCGDKIVLHCDGCGNEVAVDADSGMTEDWIILCRDCQKKLDNGN